MVKTTSLIINIFICASAFVVVHGADESWIPPTVLTPTEQCKKFRAKSPGMCDILKGQESTICMSLPCAGKKRADEQYELLLTAAKDGTVCGKSHVCRKNKCIEVSPKKLPKEEGSKSVYECD